MSRMFWNRVVPGGGAGDGNLVQETLQFTRKRGRRAAGEEDVDAAPTSGTREAGPRRGTAAPAPPKPRGDGGGRGGGRKAHPIFNAGNIHGATDISRERTGIDKSVVAQAVLGPRMHDVSRKLFEGVVIQMNPAVMVAGLTLYHLEQLVKYYGGAVTMFSSKAVTHVLADNLSTTKEKDVTKRNGRTSCGGYVVRPEWVIDCLTANQRLSEAHYTTVTPPGMQTITQIIRRQGEEAVVKDTKGVLGEPVEEIDLCTPAVPHAKRRRVDRGH